VRPAFAEPYSLKTSSRRITSGLSGETGNDLVGRYISAAGSIRPKGGRLLSSPVRSLARQWADCDGPWPLLIAAIGSTYPSATWGLAWEPRADEQSSLLVRHRSSAERRWVEAH
jgi:hypothetical protein